MALVRPVLPASLPLFPMLRTQTHPAMFRSTAPRHAASTSSCIAAFAVVLATGCAAVSMPSSVLWRGNGPASLRNVLGDARSDLPDDSEIIAGQLVIHADFPLAAKHRLVQDLESLRVDVSQSLHLPVSDEPVHLYLFETNQRYEEYAAKRFPGFPARRAFFVETDTTLSVFAAWQERIAEDLRHETTHGYVHAVVPAVPLWLDEGIAEYFELPRAENGLHREHVAHLQGRLLEGTWQPDLARLESLRSAATLTQDDYAEGWLWVHWMLRTSESRRRLLQAYLADIRHDAQKTPPISVRLVHEGGEGSMPDCVASVRSHLEQLAARTSDRR